MKRLDWLACNIHLIISALVVIPGGFVYGVPSLLSHVLDIEVVSVDQSNMHKAIMCLYIGIGVVWVLSLLRKDYWRRATELVVLFMLCLACGRILSIIMDGVPSPAYVYGTIGELILGFFAIYQLRKYARD